MSEACQICYEVPTTCVTLNCGHYFCVDCIRPSMKYNRKHGVYESCPMCRDRISYSDYTTYISTVEGHFPEVVIEIDKNKQCLHISRKCDERSSLQLYTVQYCRSNINDIIKDELGYDCSVQFLRYSQFRDHTFYYSVSSTSNQTFSKYVRFYTFSHVMTEREYDVLFNSLDSPDLTVEFPDNDKQVRVSAVIGYAKKQYMKTRRRIMA